MDAEGVLNNIVVGRAYNVDNLFSLLNGVAALMMEEPYSILIVDSIMALFRVDFTGRGELSERQQKLAQFLNRLNKLAEQFNIAVFLTNQVMADPGATMTFAGADTKKPVGGHILAHYVTTRLYFKKGRAEQRVCKLIDSPCMPEAEVTFQLTDGGVTDVTE